MVLVVLHLLPDEVVVALEDGYLFLRERHHGVVSGEEQQRRHVLHVLHESVVEFRRYQDVLAFEVGGRFGVVYYVALRNKEQVARIHVEFARVDGVFRMSFLAECHHDKVRADEMRVFGCVVGVLGQNEPFFQVLGMVPLTDFV